MKNIRLYTFAVLIADQATPKRIVVYILYRKSRDKLSSRIVLAFLSIGFHLTMSPFIYLFI